MAEAGRRPSLGERHRRIIRELVAQRIAGDILFSDDIGKAMRKWRRYFGLRQSELARLLGVSASVISDYESGRRKSPGAIVLRRFIEALLDEDERRGGQITRRLAQAAGIASILPSLVDIRELSVPVYVSDFVKLIDGVLLVPPPGKRLIHGYSIIDSIRAIETLSGSDFMMLFGASTERALIFTQVSTGRSPMVALRVFDVRPPLVVIHGPKPENVDGLAKRLAEIMKVGFAVSLIEDVSELAERLRSSL